MHGAHSICILSASATRSYRGPFFSPSLFLYFVYCTIGDFKVGIYILCIRNWLATKPCVLRVSPRLRYTSSFVDCSNACGFVLNRCNSLACAINLRLGRVVCMTGNRSILLNRTYNASHLGTALCTIPQGKQKQTYKLTNKPKH